MGLPLILRPRVSGLMGNLWLHQKFRQAWKNKSLAWFYSDESILNNWNNNDANSFEVKFKNKILDPFSFFDFKITQENNTNNGSGPYRFANKGIELGREHLVFKSQPFYAFRKDNIGKPIIPEIRFYKTIDPVDELITGKIDFAADLTFQDIARIKTQQQTNYQLFPDRPFASQ